MPVLETSTYRAPWLFRGAHFPTMYPTLCRRVADVVYGRERIATADDDFLDIDWSRVGTRRLAVLSHGLEGNSGAVYMRGMVRALNRAGWDAVAWNFRGCSGELNRLPRFYHSGETEDLRAVIAHAACSYDSVALVGFSLGGNKTLKYLGEEPDRVHPLVRRAVVFSVPCDLTTSARRLEDPENAFYLRRFLRTMKDKMRRKSERYPRVLSPEGMQRMRTFRQFDDAYTAPLHGFRDAVEYWSKASSRPFLEKIRVPTLIVSAQNDPFLTPDCFPVAEAQANPHLFLEMPRQGGHVGFVEFHLSGDYWSERRAVEWLGQSSAGAA